MTAGPTLTTRFTATVRQVGWTRDNGSGVGSGSWARWALVPTLADGKTPALHWRDGKARHVGPRTSGKAAPAWLRRAAAFVASFGPMRLHELADVADWYKVNARRGGAYPIDRLDTL